MLGLKSYSQQMTRDVRELVEKIFQVPVNENYGLNEIGVVASRCPEGGRYHVHAEHCLVEVVDDDGIPCSEGEVGRIVVTGLTNSAMPLIRYDSGDLAVQLSGPCPCGRTLPSFGDITGRYRRVTAVPPGTWDLWMAVRDAINQMPEEISLPLRQYQLHQFRNGTYVLRLAARSRLDKAFMERVHTSWKAVDVQETPDLNFEEMDVIPVGTRRKFDSFTSDYF